MYIHSVSFLHECNSIQYNWHALYLIYFKRFGTKNIVKSGLLLILLVVVLQFAIDLR